MRALYWKRPSSADLDSFGLRPDDFVDPQVELWPENVEPIRLFSRFSTQWRVGMGGPYGLDFNVFFHELDRSGVRGDDYDAVVDALFVIEATALEEIGKEKS